MSEIQNLLNQVGILVKKNNEILDANGARFNVFNVLGLEANEVKLHSALLAEFLNPEGTHGLNDEFLKEFIKQIGIEKFDTKTAKVLIEKNIGSTTENEGGRVDIIISDSNNSAIIIENKIYASDQNAQLIRYDNYGKQRFKGNHTILYLTLDGKEATKKSAGDIQYTSISYAEIILSWLEKCLEISVRYPLVRETINQYINLIKQLTGQSNSIIMNNEIISLLHSNKKYTDSAIEIIKAINYVNIQCKNRFFELLKPRIIKIVQLENNTVLSINVSEDGDGLYIGFSIKDEQNNISSSEIGMKYSQILKEINPKMIRNNWHIGWYNPDPFPRYKKFSMLDQHTIIDLYSNEQKLIKLVNDITEQNDNLINEFLKKIRDL